MHEPTDVDFEPDLNVITLEERVRVLEKSMKELNAAIENVAHEVFHLTPKKRIDDGRAMTVKEIAGIS